MNRFRWLSLVLFVSLGSVAVVAGCGDKNKTEPKDAKGHDHKEGDGHDHKEGDGHKH
ncbi:hypothetical protein WME79_40690 [Sorangium sp. So ce726]|uniref:hypothetical protein n=1 Tax=Sorangium sp. So ce726 TaxID=3133319 RepID=UPI003F6120C9